MQDIDAKHSQDEKLRRLRGHCATEAWAELTVEGQLLSRLIVGLSRRLSPVLSVCMRQEHNGRVPKVR